MRTRDEHVAWCKERALAYLDKDGRDTMNALTSMFSDLGKHPETADHIAINLGLQLMMMGSLGSERDARRFIEGFN